MNLWPIPREYQEIAAALLARLAFAMDPEIVEWEAMDEIEKILRSEGGLDLASVELLAIICRATKFNPERDLEN